MSTFVEEDVITKKMSYRSLVALLWPFLRRRRVALLIVLCLLIALVFAGRMGPQIFGMALDKGIRQNRPELLRYLVFALLFTEISRIVFSFLHSFLFQRLGNTILHDVRVHSLGHVQRMPMTYFDKNPSGRIVTRLTTDVAAVGEIFTEGLFTVFISLAELSAIIVFMFLISPKLALATLGCLPLMLWGALKISKNIQSVLRESRKTMAQLNAFTTERLNAIKLIQAMNFENPSQERYSKDLKIYFHQQMNSVRLYAGLWPLVNLFYAVTLGIAFYGATQWNLGLSIGAILAFSLHAQDIFPSMRNILERYQQFQASLTGAERVFRMTKEDEEPTPLAPFDITKISPRIGVQYKNVSFRYSESLPWVLKNFDLMIPPGTSCAIVGPTGSGKSTTISLLQRFYHDFEGKILVDEVDIRTFVPDQLRTLVQTVTQDNFLFRGSLRQNLSLFADNFSDDQLISAIERVGATSLLQRLTGLDGQILERGANLSVGERQLISLARVLVFNPPILILDEATANMDSMSEALVQKAVQQAMRHRTAVVIAHRLSTIRSCNQIAFLQNGSVAELGTHDELVRRGGEYSKYYSLL